MLEQFIYDTMSKHTDTFNRDLYTDKGTPTGKDEKELKEFIMLHGRLPQTEAEWKNWSGWNVTRNRNTAWEANMTQYGTYLMENDPDVISKVPNTPDTPDAPDVIWDESKVRQQGTKERDLYDFYKQMGDAQHNIGKTELARGEQDMQVVMAQQRKQLMDEVRSRRQNQLRSGLSSAQIANEEIQMLLMGQQAQQQTAQTYFDSRNQMNQQQQMNPYTAELQSRQHIQSGAQANSAFYASQVMDPARLTQQYQSYTPAQQRIWGMLIDPKKES